MAVDAVKALHSANHQLFIVPQNIYEFWSVATRSASAESNGMGKSPAYAQNCIDRFVVLFRLLKDERAIYEHWFDLVKGQSVSGVKSFDARLAAAMLRHSLTHILTFNGKDFRPYKHITTLEPKDVVNIP